MIFKKPEGVKAPFVNVHTHFINYNYLPDTYTSNLITEFLLHKIHWRSVKEQLKPGMMLERLIAAFPVEKMIKRLAPIIPGRIGKILRALKCRAMYSPKGPIKNYVDNGQYVSVVDLEREGELYKYDIVIPILMDLEQAAKEAGQTGILTGYKDQISEISTQAFTRPWKIFPFVMFHPGRLNSLDLCKQAVDELGYVGVKIYPAMGFYPNPEHECYNNCGETGLRIKKQLEDFYAWADERHLPVTVHAQYYAMEKINETISDASKYTRLTNWISILDNFPNIRFNFAHFGDVAYLCNHAVCVKDFSIECRDTIIGFMEKYNKDGHYRIYTDIAANYEPEFDDPGDSLKERYFESLNQVINTYPRSVMFGTDTPVLNLKISEQEYIRFFDTHIQNHKDKFFSENALDFVFGPGRRVPDNYLACLERVNPAALENYPDFISRDDTGFYVGER